MGSAGVVRHVWSGMIVAGLALTALVWIAWPGDSQRAEPAAEPSPPVRVLAAVEPDPAEGPPPVPSELEVEGDYAQELPEELGAEPLPGALLTPEPPPAAG